MNNMTPFHVLSIQASLSIIIFSLLGIWYVNPKLSKLPLEKILIPLLWTHTLRYIALVLFLPGQVSPDFPRGILSIIAYGDFITALLSLFAILMLKYRIFGALIMVWIFNFVSVIDIINSIGMAIGARVYNIPLGFTYIIVAFYVPLLVVTQAMMMYWMIKRRNSLAEYLPNSNLIKQSTHEKGENEKNN